MSAVRWALSVAGREGRRDMRGPRAEAARARALITSSAAGKAWARRARVSALLGACPRSLPALSSGFECWVTFARGVLKRRGKELPPTLEGLLLWSTTFRCAGTFSNYVTYVKKACLVACRRAPASHLPATRASARGGSWRARPVEVFRHPAVRAAKNAIEKRSGWQAKARMALQGRDVARLVSHLRVSDEGRRFAMLCLAAYAFLLRLPSEALPAVRVEDGAAAACVASAFVVGDQKIELHLSRRKNRESRSVMARQCWCDECAVTCPVHVLGAWLVGEPAHQPIWAAWSPGAARARLRRALGEMGRHDAESFGTHAFRRGHAQDIAARGGPVTDLLRAGGWHQPAWMKYLNVSRLERQSVAEAHLAESSSDDGDG